MSATAATTAGTRSAFYEGFVVHRRLAPVEHRFRYPILLALIDLSELPELLDRHPLWSARRPALAWLRAADLLGRGRRPPADAARELVVDQLGRAPSGPVLVLGHPRYFGIGFNPIRIYFLCDERGRADAAIAEVTNTPWGERHAYVFARADGELEIRGSAAKAMRVSPFMGLDQVYECRISQPSERLAVSIRSREAGRTVFEAGLSLSRLPATRAQMTRALVRYPAQTATTLGRIYWQAARLRSRVPPHPQAASPAYSWMRCPPAPQPPDP
jgi:DUF1365 family protein